MTVNAQQPHSRGATAWFLGILAFTVLIAPLVAWVPFPPPLAALPLLGPLVALLTPVRRYRWRMSVLWVVVAALVVQLILAFTASSGCWPDWLMFDDEDPSRVG
jgi:hypothetical protein